MVEKLLDNNSKCYWYSKSGVSVPVYDLHVWCMTGQTFSSKFGWCFLIYSNRIFSLLIVCHIVLCENCIARACLFLKCSYKQTFELVLSDSLLNNLKKKPIFLFWFSKNTPTFSNSSSLNFSRFHLQSQNFLKSFCLSGLLAERTQGFMLTNYPVSPECKVQFARNLVHF